MMGDMAKKTKKTKHNLKDSIAILNISAAVLAIVAIFSQIIYSLSLITNLISGFYLILFAINAHIARARILGYIFSVKVTIAMVLVGYISIAFSIWGTLSAIS
jgi:fatty acid desaturase